MNNLGSDSICHCERKSSYEHVSNAKLLRVVMKKDKLLTASLILI